MNPTIIFPVFLPTLASFKKVAKQISSVAAVVVWAHIALALVFPPC